MSVSNPSWYIPGEGNTPRGPSHCQQLIQSCQAGQLDSSTLCWREGMPQWLPLKRVPPFDQSLRRDAGHGALRKDLADGH